MQRGKGALCCYSLVCHPTEAFVGGGARDCRFLFLLYDGMAAAWCGVRGPSVGDPLVVFSCGSRAGSQLVR